jgi:hypothetical protein
VTFTAPSNVGGSAITNYYAVSNPGQITASSVTSPVTVTGLTNGTSYTFTVWALNSFGPSAYSAASGSVTPSFPYIEDVFSTWLYTGNGSFSPKTGVNTITNGIDLASKGGLVWAKLRSSTGDHTLFDTARGVSRNLSTNTTGAQALYSGYGVTSFNSNGFTLEGNLFGENLNGGLDVSWTFREQPKFFDVVTYTGNGIDGRVISHALGSIPGMIVVKCTSSGGDAYAWRVYHRSLGISQTLLLNATSAAFAGGDWSLGAPTDSTFTVRNYSSLNENGATYVAYLFAHNAGGFGLTGTDNVISCGSFTVDGSGNSSINLGYEPQWLLMKQTNTTGSWLMQDTMRGQTADNGYARLLADTSGAETSTTTGFIRINATGFSTNGATGLVGDHIYIAIRRGPMKTPTTGTSVFTTNTYTGTGAARTITTGFVTDLVIGQRLDDVSGHATADRLRGDTLYLQTNTTGAEATSDGGSQDITGFDFMTGYGLGVPNNSWMNNSGSSCANWAFRRAPGFFDVVCYSGSSSNTTQTHNLGVVPEMMIVKSRNNSRSWPVYTSPTGAGNFLFLNSTDESAGASTYWNNTTPTASVFSLGTAANTNNSGENYVAYLFATLAGVSKVGSYTGSGTTKQIDCGFTGGARFVLIKRTDVAGAWYVWDSARGIVSGNDPYLLLNSSAAEVTNTDYIDTYSAGFEISSTAPAAINANGGTFVFLAVA